MQFIIDMSLNVYILNIIKKRTKITSDNSLALHIIKGIKTKIPSLLGLGFIVVFIVEEIISLIVPY